MSTIEKKKQRPTHNKVIMNNRCNIHSQQLKKKQRPTHNKVIMKETTH